jgi:hypothetical protein
METSMARDERRVARSPMLTKLKLCWGKPDVKTGLLDVWGLNISDRGAAFVCDHPLPVMASVYLELPNSCESASGTVRDCKRWGAAWRVGVEFDAKFRALG